MIARTNLGWNSLELKLFRFFVIGFVILGVILGFTASSNNHRIKSLYDTRVEEERAILSSDLDSLTQLTKAFAPDYSQWDDPYNFLLGKLPNYAVDNLTEDTLNNFNSDAAWMFKANGTMATYRNIVKDTEGDIDMTQYQAKINELFKQNYAIHFYIKTKTGIMSLYGSTVVPTDDAQHKTKSPGYLLVGKLINDKVLKNLVTSGRVEVKYTKQDNIETAINNPDRNSGLLVYKLNYKDINGTDIGSINAKYLDGSIKVLHDSDNKLLRLNVASFLILLLALLVMIWRWVIRPVNLLYAGLEAVDKRMIDRVVENKSEFGRIADLINRFFDQDKALEADVEEKKKLLQKLETYNAEIELTNKVMIGRELRMIEMKKELAALKKENHHEQK